MRLNRLFLTLLVALLCMPLAKAEDLFVSFATAFGSTHKYTATDPQLTYNEATGTYDGSFTLYTAGSGVAKSFLLYTGTAGSPVTKYGYTGGDYKLYFEASSDTTVNIKAGAQMGWIVGSWLPGYTEPSGTINVSVNLTTNKMTVSTPKVSAGPEAYYAWVQLKSDATSWSCTTLTPESAGSPIYVGTLTTTESSQNLYMGNSPTDPKSGQFGQVVDGSSTTKDVKLTELNATETIQFGPNKGMVAARATTITNPGTYKLEYDYTTMEMTFTLLSLDAPAGDYISLRFAGEPNAYQYVTVTDRTTSESFPATQAQINVPYTPDQSQIIVALTAEAQKQGYSLKVAGPANGNPDNYELDEYPGQGWAIVPASAAAKYVFTVTVSAPKYNATFNYTGVPNAYQHVSTTQLIDNVNDETVNVPVNASPYNFEFTSGTRVIFSMNSQEREAGYSFKVTGPLGGNNSGESTEREAGAYQITSTDFEGTLQYSLLLEEGAKGYQFNIAVTYVQPAPPQELRVAFGDVTGVTPKADDPVLTLQSNGTYKGSIDVSGDIRWKFYSVDGDVTTFYGGQQWDASAQEIVSKTVALNFSETTKASSNIGSSVSQTNIGSFFVNKYPGTATQGTIAVSVDLSPNVTSVDYEFGATVVEPTKYYLYTAASEATPTPVIMVQSTVNENVYEYSLNVPSVGYQIFVSTHSKLTTGTNGNWSPAADDKEIDFTYDNKIYKATWVAGLDPAVVKMTGNMKVRFNVKSLEMEIEYLDKIDAPVTPPAPGDDILYLAINTKSYGEWPLNPATDPVMTLQEDGFYASVPVTVKRNSYIRFYSLDEDGNVEFIGPETSQTVQFPTANPYTKVFDPGIDGIISSWRIDKFTNAAATEGIVEFKVNPEISTVIFTEQVDETKAPQALYLWGNTEGGSDAPYTLAATMTPDASNPNIFTVTFDVPACGNFVYPPNGEFDPEDNDPDHGWWFWISEYTTVSQSTYGRYQGLYDDRFFDFDNTDETSLTVPVLRNDNNAFAFVAMTPGNTLFTFDWEKKELTLTYLDNTLDKSITLSFTGDAPSAYNLESAVQVVDLARVDDDADDPMASGILAIFQNPYTYKYENQGGLLFVPQGKYIVEAITSNYVGSEPPYEIFTQDVAADDDEAGGEFKKNYTLQFGPKADGITFEIKLIKMGESGVEGIGVEEGEVSFYNLQGQRVVNPERGIYIRVEGGKATKVVK